MQDTEERCVIDGNGTTHYFKRNYANTLIFHRNDGPAIEWADGTYDWYHEGGQYSFEDWLDLQPWTDEEKVMFKLKYG